MQHISHPDSLYQAVSQTGLALRDRKPRVRDHGGRRRLERQPRRSRLRPAVRLLNQLKMPNAEVTAIVFCGAPDDPATPKSEQANVYATLTELSHFCDPNVPFTAQYGDGRGSWKRGRPSATSTCSSWHIAARRPTSPRRGPSGAHPRSRAGHAAGHQAQRSRPQAETEPHRQHAVPQLRHLRLVPVAEAPPRRPASLSQPPGRLAEEGKPHGRRRDRGRLRPAPC